MENKVVSHSNFAICESLWHIIHDNPQCKQCVLFMMFYLSNKQIGNSTKYTLTQFQINKQKWYNFNSKYKHKYIKHFQKHKHIYTILNK